MNHEWTQMDTNGDEVLAVTNRNHPSLHIIDFHSCSFVSIRGNATFHAHGYHRLVASVFTSSRSIRFLAVSMPSKS
jgi:hypothetical protein